MAVIGITSFIVNNGGLVANTNQVGLLTDAIKADLTNNKWSVNSVIVSPFPNGWNVLVSVNGSNKDNLATVARSFNTTMQKYGFVLQNTVAVMSLPDTVISNPTNTGTNTNPNTNNNTNPQPQPGFLDSYAKSLGVSSAVLALAVIGILIVVTKK
jgi:hypothetical protein